MPMSEAVKASEPVIRQLFIGRGPDVMVPDALERKLYVIRKTASHAIRALNLKHGRGFLRAVDVHPHRGLRGTAAGRAGRRLLYRDLADPRAVSAIALVHQRFSADAFPAWELAHPYRMVAHNGEINTVKGNVNWLNARTGAIACRRCSARTWPSCGH
ncbi:Glutamate synthase subunit alpha OS=Rhodanobacter lindaniclasticus OX=75310 GN=B1991_15170 PE=3 SV=1 [Rhodanobacter lindaniclasticus]